MEVMAALLQQLSTCAFHHRSASAGNKGQKDRPIDQLLN